LYAQKRRADRHESAPGVGFDGAERHARLLSDFAVRQAVARRENEHLALLGAELVERVRTFAASADAAGEVPSAASSSSTTSPTCAESPGRRRRVRRRSINRRRAIIAMNVTSLPRSGS